MAEKINVEEILSKYGQRIESQISTSKVSSGDYSNQYVKFRNEMSSELGRYERWCQSLGNIFKIKVSEKDSLAMQKFLQTAHLDVEPSQALTLSFMGFLVTFLAGFLISIGIFLIKGMNDFANFPILFFSLILIFSIFIFYFLNKYPSRLANKWRLKASSQLVPAILYVVVYMRHTANLEKAIAFAAENLQPPLSLDFRKVFYDVQIGKFSTIKESLDNYLSTWKDYGPEFVEGFHLIEASLFEPDNERRIQTLEKALKVVLDGVYDRMLKFTHEVRSPLNNVYMLGVVLPTLALALLPLASAMIGNLFKWYHIFILFNLIIPFFVFYLTERILENRPGGYGETSLLEKNPLYPKYVSKKPYLIAGLISLPFVILGILPLIFQMFDFSLFGISSNLSLGFLGIENIASELFFDFKGSGFSKGAFGIGAIILSLFLPLGIALFFSISSRYKTKDLIIERTKTKQLEEEFNSSLFQLGNRLGNGVPAEMAFGKVAEISQSQRTSDFFRLVNFNVQRNGMSVEKAIFDSRRGAINLYPSELIATSMKILIESSKKGLKIAAVSLMSISEYLNNIKKINTRLNDMLAEIVSDMKSNMTFLAPFLSGIVVGLSVMITTILNRLNLATLGQSGISITGGISNILEIFNLENMIAPYYLQVFIGFYLIEIIFILTGTLVTIDSGEDRLERTNKIGKNLSVGILLYLIVSFIGTILLYVLSSVVVGGFS